MTRARWRGRLSAAGLIALALAGCGGGTDERARAKPRRPAERLAVEGLPETADVLHGKSATLGFTLAWKTGPKEEVRLSVEVSPSEGGVTALVKPPEDGRGALVVSVSETAAPGDYTVKLTASADRVGDVVRSVTVKVPPKD